MTTTRCRTGRARRSVPARSRLLGAPGVPRARRRRARLSRRRAGGGTSARPRPTWSRWRRGSCRSGAASRSIPLTRTSRRSSSSCGSRGVPRAGSSRSGTNLRRQRSARRRVRSAGAHGARDAAAQRAGARSHGLRRLTGTGPSRRHTPGARPVEQRWIPDHLLLVATSTAANEPSDCILSLVITTSRGDPDPPSTLWLGARNDQHRVIREPFASSPRRRTPRRRPRGT